MVIFTTLSVVIWFSTGTLGIFSTLAYVFTGRGQNLERTNVERLIFRKFETSNIEITKVELFNFFIFKFISYIQVCLNCSNTQNI